MALGATRREICLLFVRRAAASAAIGLAAGSGAALLLNGLLRSQLFGVSPSNPLAFLAAALVLLVPMLLAALRPALLAASSNPADALRAE